MTEIATQTTQPAEEVTPEQVADHVDQAKPTDADDPAGDGDDGKAAKLRKRAQEAETERDSLRTQLSSTLDRVLDYEAERIKVNPALLRAAGLSAADHVGDDGVLDITGLAEAIEAKRVELGIPRKPQPNPLAGSGRGDALVGGGRADWDGVFGS